MHGFSACKGQVGSIVPGGSLCGWAQEPPLPLLQLAEEEESSLCPGGVALQEYMSTLEMGGRRWLQRAKEVKVTL